MMDSSKLLKPALKFNNTTHTHIIQKKNSRSIGINTDHCHDHDHGIHLIHSRKCCQIPLMHHHQCCFRCCSCRCMYNMLHCQYWNCDNNITCGHFKQYSCPQFVNECNSCVGHEEFNLKTRTGQETEERKNYVINNDNETVNDCSECKKNILTELLTPTIQASSSHSSLNQNDDDGDSIDLDNNEEIFHANEKKTVTFLKAPHKELKNEEDIKMLLVIKALVNERAELKNNVCLTRVLSQLSKEYLQQ